MKVSHFSTFPYGGAAAAGLRTHRQLQKTGVDSQFFFHRNDRDEKFESSVRQADLAEPKQGLFQRLTRGRQKKQRNKSIYQLYDQHLATRDPQAETFSMARLPEESFLSPASVDADVIHLHWLAFFADYESFFQSIPTTTPIVWTLHDMNPFTGGCHYAGACESFKTGCGNCPQIVSPSPNDVSVDSFNAKRDALAERQNHVVAPSQWMIDLASQSPIWPDNTTFEKIHLGFDLNDFHPIEKSKARSELGIQTDAVLIGFGADDINSHRKGLHHLMNCLPQLRCQNQVECLVFGGGEIPPADNLPKFHSQGFVDSVQRQRLIYSASDLVVVPSREDNQPQVGLEAMACGTPVVGFDAGGIPEYVRPGKTGCLVPLGDEQKLAEAISNLVDLRSMRLRLGASALEMVQEEFELNAQTRAYQDLYQRVTDTAFRSKAA